MKLVVPELALVVLVGPSGSGKSTFAHTHFKGTEILSSDACRGLVSDDENNQSATQAAFEVLHFIAAQRLKRGLLTVVDATNVQAEARKPLVSLAQEFHVLPVAIVFDLPERLCQDRNRGRSDRSFGPHVIRQQSSQLRRSLRGLGREGFRHLHVLDSADAVENATIERQPLWNNLRGESGPFDIIGDVHGCASELEELLAVLGYLKGTADTWAHPRGRRVVFLGDLVDRGPGTPAVLRAAMAMTAAGSALCVPGNHDAKLLRALRGRDVRVAHGLQESLDQLALESPEFRSAAAEWIDDLVSHYVLDGGKLVVAHAGMREEMQGRGSGKVREFALYGETTGETDDFGLPVRFDWAAEYRGPALVVYGHTPVSNPEWLNGTINIDTGCVFGGRLTALRYPERELISVPAHATYAEPVRPLRDELPPARGLNAQQEHDDVLDLSDLLGKRLIETSLQGRVTIREENGIAALEILSRFAVHPKWLLYLPPTMPPPKTTQRDGLLEHPDEVFDEFARAGVSEVVCEEKHMGSRVVVVACRDAGVARARFGVTGDEAGICYTRTGRRFFSDPRIEREVLDIVRSGLSRAGTWEELSTDWVCLDCELMPWSAKAQELIRSQYAPVGAAATSSLSEAVRCLRQAKGRGIDLAALEARFSGRLGLVERYIEAYRGYTWPVNGVEDLRLAPFHVLASEGSVHTNKPHRWHLEHIGAFVQAAASVTLVSTAHQFVALEDPTARAEAVKWWEARVSAGGEGMVVKPATFTIRGKRGVVQPAVKCRGPEYLRIIYGPEYSLPENLERLRQRGLSHKRSLALREFALGVEGLERFVARQPLRKVHECVFGVLALESEPVDPRL